MGRTLLNRGIKLVILSVLLQFLATVMIRVMIGLQPVQILVNDL